MRPLLVLIAIAACDGGSSPSQPIDAPLPFDATPDVPAPVDPPHRCEFADCQDAFARSCNEAPTQLDCRSFGASCGAFTDTESGVPFHWCDCGTLAEGDGMCVSGRYGVACVDGLGGLADCGQGYTCVPRPNGPFGIGCECNNFDDGVCPGLACSSDPDCATCTPACGGKACGDNGCGGECGTCEVGDECNAQQQCVSICVPSCTGKTCGPDGCGGTCGTCTDGATCTATGTCQGPCVPDCTDRTCGSDGCGGSCGTCPSDLECGSQHTCTCDFFATLDYAFTLPPSPQWPAWLTAVSVNVKHINIDGTPGTPNGAALGYGTTFPNLKQIFLHRVHGCRPKIEIDRQYILGNGGSCTRTDVVEGRLSFELPLPTMTAAGCTAPAW